MYLMSNNNIVVTCASNADCSKIPERKVCKQEKDGGKTCQNTTVETCEEEEFLDVEDTCTKPGAALNIKDI